jgi:hypothetical protein
MEETASQLLEQFARATRDATPPRTHWTAFNTFIIYVHRHRVSITTAEITKYLLSRNFTLEQARQMSLIFVQGSELLLQYDKQVTA